MILAFMTLTQLWAACPTFDGARTYGCDFVTATTRENEKFTLNIQSQGSTFEITAKGFTRTVVADGQTRVVKAGGQTFETSATCDDRGRLVVRTATPDLVIVDEFYPMDGGIVNLSFHERGSARTNAGRNTCHYPPHSR